ncbi:spindle pole body component 110-like protein [Gossypium australe]|uniref:Spindle pole body component 110-like protein n=1 Tax=Gossypium australe TaxID=47621 RepID=A0A5B6WJC1_9ROSI|nr:spindle pole body component 110-like protein [Gossypium australe]
MKKRVDVFTLSICSLVVFPKALGHIDETVSDLFDRFDKRILECMLESGRWQIYRVCATFVAMVPQPFLESGKGLISNLFRKLFSPEIDSGYAETG